MKIFLIRHGESICNSHENFKLGVPDHKVYLTEKGVEQAYKSAQSLIQYLNKKDITLENSRMWVSPYMRTRQTAEIFNEYLNISDVKEHLNIVEQQYGLFDALPMEAWKERYPDEFEYYNKSCNYDGRFWARLPLGESAFDVAIRVHQFFGTIHRDFEKHGTDKLFIFTHGTTLRAFVMQWLHCSPEWFENEKNPNNCWIRLIDNNEDMGYIYSE